MPHPKLPRVVAKHKLVLIEDDKRKRELCDVMSWDDDSTQLPHGISAKLEVTTRRKTRAKLVKHFPKFRLTPRAGEATRLTPILERLRKHDEAAVVVLNKHGWVGYLLPHFESPKFYCHFHHQEHMDATHQRLSQKPLKMVRLAPVPHGPWTRQVGAADFREELDGPDYDPALVYTMEELDPYKDAPDLSDSGTQAAVPSLDPDYNHEASTFEDGFNLNLDRGGQEGHDFTPSRRNGQDPHSAQAEAAAKYGEELRTEAQQASSFIYHLKRFNNWVKATLISKASKDPANSGLRVLDLACGKGGDLGKWATHPDGIEKYVGSDIAFGSLEHLVERLAKSIEKGGRASWRKIPVMLFEADLGENDVQRDRLKVWENMGPRRGEWDDRIPLNEGSLFDVASMQFALHYMGQTERRMRRFLHEVSRHLRVGGIFIATTMDSRMLMQLLMGHAQRSWDSSRGRTIHKVEIEDERKHNLLSIGFKDSPQSYLLRQSQDKDVDGPFGLEYTFTLRETELKKNAVDDVPEWMLPLDALKKAAMDFGLHLETAQNFHEFFAHESQADPARQNLRHMHVFNSKGTMNETEWRIAGIYMALVFRKTSKEIAPIAPMTVEGPAPPSPPYPPPRQYPPASPKAPPPNWEGPAPRFPPKSPEHPPPRSMDVAVDADRTYTPRSPEFPPTSGYAPRSPSTPPPDADSDEDEAFNNALDVARSTVPPEKWESLSSGEKMTMIMEKQRLLQ